VCEHVRPLSHVLNEIIDWTDVDRNLISWGIYQVAVRVQRSAAHCFTDRFLVDWISICKRRLQITSRRHQYRIDIRHSRR
jgi:hypothetical protein